MTLPKVRFSKLKQYHFIDVNDLDIGSLEDIILDVKSLVPTHFILGAGFFEELMEELGEKDDVDEIAPIDIVSETGKETILVGLPLDMLPTTTNDGMLPIEGIRYTVLLRYAITDSSGKFEGSLVDIEINGSESRFIFRSPLIMEQLQTKGYFQSFEVSFLTSQVSLRLNQIQIPFIFDDILESIQKTIEPQMKGISHVKY